jgi:hypothetical protein
MYSIRGTVCTVSWIVITYGTSEIGNKNRKGNTG